MLSAFRFHWGLAVLAACAVVLTAGYILWTLQRVLLGKNEHWKGLPDLSLREWIVAIPLVVLTIVLGVFPQSLLSWMGPSVSAMVNDVVQATATAPADGPGARVAALPDRVE